MASFEEGIVRKVSDYKYAIWNNGRGMHVEPTIYYDDGFMREAVDEYRRFRHYGDHPIAGARSALNQLMVAASLPGVIDVIAMPDLHTGSSLFPVGSVTVVDPIEEGAVICAGGVGGDINCGVRFVISDLTTDNITSGWEWNDFTTQLEKSVDVGVGPSRASHANRRYNQREFAQLLRDGMKWTRIAGAHAKMQNPLFCEDGGCYPGADPSILNSDTLDIGAREMGSLGAGNHYLEVCRIEKIYDAEAAATFGIKAVGQIGISVHTGSRGLGQGVVKSFAGRLSTKADGRQYKIRVPGIDNNSSCLYYGGDNHEAYEKAKACAMNFAYVNRTVIAHAAIQALIAQSGVSARTANCRLVTDVCHNTVKLEDHIDPEGERRQLLIHRKGSSLALPPGDKRNPSEYANTGTPVFIGGSMGTWSYLTCSTPKGARETYNSTAHGAGRRTKRSEAVAEIRESGSAEQHCFEGYKELQGIHIQTPNANTFFEEAPSCYKDIDRVVDICCNSGLNKKICKIVPMYVMKG